MRIECLDHSGARPTTFLIEFKGNTILYNCPLEVKSLSKLTGIDDASPPPQQQQQSLSSGGGFNHLDTLLSRIVNNTKSIQDGSLLDLCDDGCVFRTVNFSLVDLNQIDVVLVANSEMMLGLPFLTEYLGYKGKIIATEPTIEFARQRMEELVAYHGRQGSFISPGSAIHFSQVGSMNRQCVDEQWRSLYTLRDIKLCMQKIKPVRFNEHLSLYETTTLVPYSSGYSLGSANWCLEATDRKVVLMSTSSIVSNRHPALFDMSIMEKADVVLVSDVRTGDQNDTDHIRKRILGHVAMTLQSQKNVLFPISMIGNIFDLIGDLARHLKALNMPVSFYVVSPVARTSLEYANILGEWMTAGHQDTVNTAQKPLEHGQLQQEKELFAYDSLQDANDIKEPCVLFTGDHTCLRKGPVVSAVEHWGGDQRNICIITDPETLASQDLPSSRMKMVPLILNTRVSLWEVGSILGTACRITPPPHIIIPDMLGSDRFKERWEMEHPGATQLHTINPGESVSIEFTNKMEMIVISEELAARLAPQAAHKDGVFYAIAPVTGSLAMYNNNYELQPITDLCDEYLLNPNHHPAAS
ncbi:beta-lactamase-like protein [Zychaea mexicana]|uniref:beta-lactamase-like protein n=1 Tax=Zychaea mexicana TaxID=64656 RepID=UPI0022FE76E0|nr:beta-lactamase-like protein [Zychaea mexicana]KAI9490800.1 beta-lactamase-like protein [Zychaea mexicana]